MVETQDFVSLPINGKPMDKFKGKYRIPSARWASWDYSRNAAYFITICTADRTHHFGEITDGAMALTPLGQAAMNCWNEIPAHFPFVVLDEFTAMPNHVHGILVIDKPEDRTAVETQNFASTTTTRTTPTPKPIWSAITESGIHRTWVQNRRDKIRPHE